MKCCVSILHSPINRGSITITQNNRNYCPREQDGGLVGRDLPTEGKLIAKSEREKQVFKEQGLV